MKKIVSLASHNTMQSQLDRMLWNLAASFLHTDNRTRTLLQYLLRNNTRTSENTHTIRPYLWQMNNHRQTNKQTADSHNGCRTNRPYSSSAFSLREAPRGFVRAPKETGKTHHNTSEWIKPRHWGIGRKWGRGRKEIGSEEMDKETHLSNLR